MPLAEGSQTQLRRHGDIFERLPGGYYTAKGRSDDTMNLGGIKVYLVYLSSLEDMFMTYVKSISMSSNPQHAGCKNQIFSNSKLAQVIREATMHARSERHFHATVKGALAISSNRKVGKWKGPCPPAGLVS